MGFRTAIANSFIVTGRTLGQLLGLEVAVIQSDHSLAIQMESPDQSKRAWDSNLIKSGNLFLADYANPVKLTVKRHSDLEEPNTVGLEEGNNGELPDGETVEGDVEHGEEEQPQVITSGRYREFMRQDLISQLLTPESRWNLLVWAVVGLGALQFTSMLLTLWATGSF